MARSGSNAQVDNWSKNGVSKSRHISTSFFSQASCFSHCGRTQNSPRTACRLRLRQYDKTQELCRLSRSRAKVEAVLSLIVQCMGRTQHSTCAWIMQPNSHLMRVRSTLLRMPFSADTSVRRHASDSLRFRQRTHLRKLLTETVLEINLRERQKGTEPFIKGLKKEIGFSGEERQLCRYVCS